MRLPTTLTHRASMLLATGSADVQGSRMGTRAIWALLAIVSLGLASGFVAMNNASRKPRLRLPHDKIIDLGSGAPGEVLESSLTLQNVGDEPLTFKLAGSCSCSDIAPKVGVLSGREAIDIRIGVRVPKAEGAHSVRVLIVTNDPQHSTDQVRLRLVSLRKLYTTPASVDFGLVPAGRSATAILKVHSRGPALNSEDTLIATVDSRFIECTPMADDPTCVNLVLSSTAPVGPISGSLHITRKGTGDALDVAYTATVADRFIAAPSIVYIEDSLAKQFVVFRQDRAVLGAVRRIEAPPGVLVNTLSSTDTLCRFSVQYGHSSCPNDARCTVCIFFENEEEPATITVARLPR